MSPSTLPWFLIWVAAIAALLFVIVHAIYVRYFAKPRQFAPKAAPVDPAKIPAHVPRHSLVARAFHWVMAASMFTLLFTAFLPKVGVQLHEAFLPGKMPRTWPLNLFANFLDKRRRAGPIFTCGYLLAAT